MRRALLVGFLLLGLVSGAARASAREDQLWQAVRSHEREAIKAAAAPPMLVAAGADPALKAQDGSTLAIAAAGGGNLEALKYALQMDQDVNVLTHDGRSIVHVVVANRFGADNPAILQYLVDKGAKLEMKDHAGITPGIMVNRAGPQSLRVAYIKILTDRAIISIFH